MLTRDAIIDASSKLNLAVQKGVLPEEAANPFKSNERHRVDVLAYLRQLMSRGELDSQVTESDLKPLAATLVGMGPLDELIVDKSVSSIQVLDYDHVLVNRGGVWDRVSVTWESKEAFANFAYGLASRSGTAIDKKDHLVVQANFQPAGRIQIDSTARNASGVTLHIRRGRANPITLTQMLAADCLSPEMFDFVFEVAQRDMGVLIVGKPGTGKTTLLEAWMDMWPPVPSVGLDDRSEFFPRHPLCSLYDVPPERLSGALSDALRKNVARIAVAEVRGDEAAEMLRYSAAMTMWTTLHSTVDNAVLRLSGLVKGAPNSPYANVPDAMLRQTIAVAFPIVVETEVIVVGGRPTFFIAEIAHLGVDGETHPLFQVKLDGPHLRGFGLAAEEDALSLLLRQHRRRIWGGINIPALTTINRLADKSPGLALAALGEYMAVRRGDQRAVSLLSSLASQHSSIRNLIEESTLSYEAEIERATSFRDWGALLEIASRIRTDPVVYELSYGRLTAKMGNLSLAELSHRASEVASGQEAVALSVGDPRHVMALVGLMDKVAAAQEVYSAEFFRSVSDSLKHIRQNGEDNLPAHLRLLPKKED